MSIFVADRSAKRVRGLEIALAHGNAVVMARGTVVFHLCILISCCGSSHSAAVAGDPHPKSGLVISAETTAITEPVTKEGWLNYGAAIEKYRWEGITRDNNAAPVVMQNVWIKDPSAYEAMGLPAPKSHRGLIRSFADFEESGSWPEEPGTGLFDAWLEESNAALERVCAGLQREFLVFPMRFGSRTQPRADDDLLSCRLDGEVACRSIGQLLCIRAMRRAEAGDWSGAKTDLLLARKLARMLARRANVMTLIISCALERRIFAAERHCLNQSLIPADEVRAYREAISAIPTHRFCESAVDLNNRLLMLATTQRILRGKPVGESDDSVAMFPYLDPKSADPTVAMRIVNAHQDRLLKLTRMRDIRFGRRRWEEYAVRLREMNEAFQRLQNAPGAIGKRSPQQRAKQIGNATIVVFAGDIRMVQRFELECNSRDGVLRLALAMLEFKHHRGRFPRSIDQLVPDYLHEVPIDPITTKPLAILHRPHSVIAASTTSHPEELLNPNGDSQIGLRRPYYEPDVSILVVVLGLLAVSACAALLFLLTNWMRRGTRTRRSVGKFLTDFVVAIATVGVVVWMTMAFGPFKIGDYFRTVGQVCIGALAIAIVLDRIMWFRDFVVLTSVFVGIGFIPWHYEGPPPALRPIYKVYQPFRDFFDQPFLWCHIGVALITTVFAALCVWAGARFIRARRRVPAD